MATVTGVTAQRANEIDNKSIQEIFKTGRDLNFKTKGGAILTISDALPAPFEMYPVNSIYISTSSANPATYMGGGTWQRWGEGRVPVGVKEADPDFESSEKVGGLKEVVLDETQMPSHSHSGKTEFNTQDHLHTGSTYGAGGHSHSYTYPHTELRTVVGGGPIEVWGAVNSAGTTGAVGEHAHDVLTHNESNKHDHPIPPSGGNQSHTNLQPYVTAYMWKRTG